MPAVTLCPPKERVILTCHHPHLVLGLPLPVSGKGGKVAEDDDVYYPWQCLFLHLSSLSPGREAQERRTVGVNLKLGVYATL